MSKSKIKTLLTRADRLVTDLESLRDDMQADWDDRSERWQDSDRGAEAQEMVDHLDAAADMAQSVVDELAEAL